MNYLLPLLGLLFLSSALADEAQGISFNHHDWNLTCDNTRTCRAVGYYAYAEDANPIALMLTRAAGANQAVSADVIIAVDAFDSDAVLPQNSVKFGINGQIIGDEIALNDAGDGKLSPEQTQALLEVLTDSSRIEFFMSDKVWRLSDKGSTAVLLKMDDVQGRVDAVDALVRKGTKSADQALAPLPMPVITTAPIKPLPLSHLSQQDILTLQNELPLAETECHDDNTENLYQLEALYQLSPSQLLVVTPCWLAAYNYGSAYWLINTQAKPHLIQF